MKMKNSLDIRQLKVPLILTIVFWVIAIAFWQSKGNIFFLFNFGYIGTSIGIGLGAYIILPKKKKHWGHPICAKDALKISFGFDFGNRELLNRKG